MNDEIKPRGIDSDEYKYEACSITRDECCGHSCGACEIAQAELRNVQEEEIKSIYTFKERTQNNIKAEVNLYNTVLKCGSVDDAFTHMAVSNINKDRYVKVCGLLDKEVINKEHPHLNIVMEKLDLKPCTESYYLQEWPLVTVFGDVVLATAPLIETDTTD